MTNLPDGLISQLVSAGTTGQDFDGKGPNFMLSVIRGISREMRLNACSPHKWQSCT